MKLKHVMLIPQLAGCISAICVDAAQLDDVNQFDIPQGRSDQTLAEFARQAGITVIVPYDKSVEVTTNPVVGSYSVLEAALKLMENTNLRLAISETGQLTIKTANESKGFEPMMTKNKLSGAIAMAVSSLAMAQVSAQEASDTVFEEVVVTGVRGSLERAMDIKRESNGVVDAISAEAMGKFPDTNLAESLQRITGVSINRVNGEGSEVTVRGFGGSFNMVTLNGRQMPTANVTTITGNPLDQGGSGTSRAFDFSNIASEGVTGIQVYKTGRAAIPTGGIGAAINVDTLKPLDRPGISGSIGIKGMHDTSVDEGDDVTPEIQGLFSWTDDSDRFGVSVFGSLQERDFGSRTVSIERFDLATMGPETLSDLGMGSAEVRNVPQDGQLVAIPSNIGLGVNEDSRERLNGQLTLQFRPMESLTLTADATYAQNQQESTAVIDGIWFARQFTEVEFDGNPIVATPSFLEEDIEGGKDFFFQNLSMATEDTLESYGFNADWQVNDNLNLRFDFATSEAESTPDGAFGKNVVRFNMAGATAGFQTAEFNAGGIPQASVVIDDEAKGNNNGIFDKPDVGSQVSQATESSQSTEIDQVRFEGTWELDGGGQFDFGVGYVDTEMSQFNLSTQATLGGWGVDNPGDIPEGLFEQSCTGCEFENNGNNVTGVEGAPGIPLGSVSFKGNAVELLEEMAPVYGFEAGNLPATGRDDNLVEEEILSAFMQLDIDGQLGKFPINTVFGVRYETTDVDSSSLQQIPLAIQWDSDNDFTLILSDNSESLSESGSYTNLLPSLDFSIDLRDDLIGRVSFSKTLARPEYDQLFTATSINSPPRPTALGGSPSGSVGNADLDPLESNNVDISLEWYYGESSFFSIGFYDKRVTNFVGTEQVTSPLFGLRDPTSGQEGTLSGDAIAALNDQGVTVTERNFFTMAAILDNPDQFPGGVSEFDESQEFAEEVFSNNAIIASATDPLFGFELTQPINSRDAKIHGFEVASQHFFGDTGFGYQANFTTVSGDIGFNRGSDPSQDQFALEGLSDSANLVLIYEKYGASARLAWNWRDEFLNQVNRSQSSVRNPEFIDDFAQWDLNVSYDLTDNLTVSFDAINLTEEEVRHFGRTKQDIFFIQELDRRFLLGARYTF